MVLLGDAGSRAYLKSTDVLPSLEIGIEEMLKACTEAESNRNPVNFLAEWLMRHNPRHNPEMAALVEERRKAAAIAEAAEARRLAEEEERMAAERALEHVHEVAGGVEVELPYPGGKMVLALPTDP